MIQKNNLYLQAIIAFFLWIIFAVCVATILLPFLGIDQSQLNNFLSSFTATTLGIVIGIPIALLLNDHENKILEQRESDQQKKRTEEKSKKTLELIKNEPRRTHDF